MTKKRKRILEIIAVILFILTIALIFIPMLQFWIKIIIFLIGAVGAYVFLLWMKRKYG
jgi:MFS-type transporter involved in bile tolerance (Atg22 family)